MAASQKKAKNTQEAKYGGTFLYKVACTYLVTVFTVLHGMQTRSSDGNSVRLSVCLSVRPSVKRVHCDKTEESYV